MATKAPPGTIVTRVLNRSQGFDNTRPGWPNSSLEPVFNRSGGPSAAEILHGTEQSRDEAVGRRPVEVAEVIDQENLPLGDALQYRSPGKDANSREDAEAAEVSGHLGGDHGPEAISAPTRYMPVEVQVRTVPNRGGRRPSQEQYPFGSIGVARMVDGQMEGESFFIPDDDHPLRKMAAARKRHRPKVFISRKDKERGGLWVWRQR